MPPVGMGSKGKSKAKEGRQSRSRNTTPNSVVSAAVSTGQGNTSFLDIPTGNLMIPNNISYDDILEKHGGTGGIPDPKHLETLANDLKTLSQLAEVRGQACDGGMRELSSRRKERIEEEREREQAIREAEENETLKRAAEDDEDSKARKGGKLKRRKDQSRIREERPLTHGAHGLARQDGIDVTSKDPSSPKPAPIRKSETIKSLPSKQKEKATSGSSSSLSPASQVQSPTAAPQTQDANLSAHVSPSPSSSSLDSHQPLPAPSIMQHQTFGADPLAFDDPTIYHVRKVTEDMSDEEKKEIYGVAQFPHDDLSHLIAGVPPDKDFSNAKPTNQVHANTFNAYIEPYFRPLTDEDLAFLKERGDRLTPFLMPRRGKKHYTEIWAEEDGAVAVDRPQAGNEKLPQNQPRGNIEQMDDETAETDQVSAGPLLSRLLSTMRPEHRISASEEKDKASGVFNGNGESSVNGFMNGDSNGDNIAEANGDDNSDRIPSATFMPESASQGWKVPNTKLDYAQMDERLKMELRHIGFLPPDVEPDYDAHYDDEVAQRLRFLQAELKKQSIINGARKARILQITQERMAYQEFHTILEDLDEQIIQAYQKRNRTLGKGKKNVKRPGGAGGGSHYVTVPATSAGVTRPGIGDSIKTLLERRKKWMDTITPVFDDDVTRVRGEDDPIFQGPEWEACLAAERERFEEEADAEQAEF